MDMTFIITLYVREGIVMASDSRLTLSATIQEQDRQVVQMAVAESDSTYKTFLAPNNIGISIYGAADIQGVPLGGFVESFINEKIALGSYAVDQVAQELLTYFRDFPKPPEVGFLVAGYKKADSVPEQHIWEALIAQNRTERLNQPGVPGAAWRGETDVMRRLIQPVFLQTQGGYIPIQHHQIQWGFFTLQDAIDYAIYAVKTTIDTMRFHPRPKTVGGPIDVLVIKPDRAWWVQRKELHV
jgi:hypothetical protein